MEDLEEVLMVKNTDEQNLTFLLLNNLIKNEYKCESCSNKMKIVNAPRYKDKFAWRCHVSSCSNYRKRINIRKGSFFDGFRTDIKTILKVLIRWSGDQQQHRTLKSVNVDKACYKKIIDKLLNLIMKYNAVNLKKMGGPGNIVQVDKLQLSCKSKSHHSRNFLNETDALTIIEYKDDITWAYAEVIPNRNHNTILPIICKHVIPGSVIHTDEHKSYSSLCELGFCQKFQFVSKEEGAHTQAVESFSNCLKLQIKQRKGVVKENRGLFLMEYLWKFNNRNNRFQSLLELIKV